MTGIITSNKMQKCVVVLVSSTARHTKYGKSFKVRKKYKASCSDSLSFPIGSTVKITSTRPKSKHIRWKVVEN